MEMLQPKTGRQLFEATVNLEFDYFISLLEDMSISDFGERISIKDADNDSVAFYFDNHLIFKVSPSGSEESVYPIPMVERFYLNLTEIKTIQ